VVGETTGAIGDADPRADDESCAFFKHDQLNIAIEFTKGSSMNTPTWCTSYQRFTTKLAREYPELVDL